MLVDPWHLLFFFLFSSNLEIQNALLTQICILPLLGGVKLQRNHFVCVTFSYVSQIHFYRDKTQILDNSEVM